MDSSVSRLGRIIYIDQCLEVRKAEGTRVVQMMTNLGYSV